MQDEKKEASKPKFYEDRIDKLRTIRELNIDPYPHHFTPTHTSKQIIEEHENLQKEEKTENKVTVAGRIIQLRRMGKATFCHIQDTQGKIQLYIRKDNIGEKGYQLLKLLDIGDHIGVHGIVFSTKTGEITVKAKEITVLCKALQQLPEKYHGLKDKELRYRQRYVDLIMNPEAREVLMKRSQILAAMRGFLNSKGFTEVEVPTLHTVYGGANARPFITHINAWDMKMYLSISPELFLKKLIVGGFDKVYTICKNFRNEGVDRSHNPEFTMMECYAAYWDYNDMMKLTEDMCSFIAKKVMGSDQIEYQGTTLQFAAPWNKLTMKEAIKKHANIDVDALSDEELFELRITYNITVEGQLNRGKMMQLLFEELCEDKLIQPTFIIDHPKESTPLCKTHRDNKELIERFEPFVNGIELGNAYSELNDPLLQKKLLEEQAEELRAGAEEAHPMDEDFVRAIEFGMPPTGGLGIGVDRLTMFLTNQPSLRDVIAFPTMKPEKTNQE